ncbi:hypothetical protein O206_02670 [Ochrobactrum sp. EGD-AQ16]|nr:hypothetical protein O206_02670 [Ochrobactrum sp. EGD-AQ16]
MQGQLIKVLQQLQALPVSALVAYAISNAAANQKREAATIESIRGGATTPLQIDSVYQIQQIKNK